MRYFLKFFVFFFSVILISCHEDDKNLGTEVTNASSLFVKEKKILKNQEISFQLIDGEKDNTAAATFFINNTPIEGSKFSSETLGTFRVYAEYNLMGIQTSTAIDSFEVFTPKRKVLIEGITGTWCGWCPRLKTGFDKVRNSLDDDSYVLVSIHKNSSVDGGDDPYHTSESTILADFFEIFGVPWGKINRNEDWSNQSETLYTLDQLTPYAGVDTDISLGINSELKNNSLNVTIKVISETTIKNNKLVVFLLEDGLLYDQVNYYNTIPESPFYGMGDPIPNFEHNNVLRASITDPLGSEIPETPALKEYSKEFSTIIPSEYNPSNLQIVAIFVNNDNSVRNAQVAKINQQKNYQ